MAQQYAELIIEAGQEMYLSFSGSNSLNNNSIETHCGISQDQSKSKSNNNSVSQQEKSYNQANIISSGSSNMSIAQKYAALIIEAGQQMYLSCIGSLSNNSFENSQNKSNSLQHNKKSWNEMNAKSSSKQELFSIALIQKQKSSSSFSQMDTIIVQMKEKHTEANEDININQQKLVIIENLSALKNESSQQVQIQLLKEVNSNDEQITISQNSSSFNFSNSEKNNLSMSKNDLQLKEINKAQIICDFLKWQNLLKKIDDQGNQIIIFQPNYEPFNLTPKQAKRQQLKDQMKVLKFQKTFLKNNNPEFAQTLNKTALMLKQKGNYQKALSFFQQGLQIFQQNFGKKNQKYLENFLNMCQVHTKKGNYKIGYNYMNQIKDLALSTLGQKNILYAKILHFSGLAESYFEDDKKAIRIFKKTIRIRQQLKCEQQSIQNVKTSLAYSLCTTKKYTQALQTTNQIKQCRKKQKRIDYYQDALLLNIEGTIYLKLKQYQNALKSYQQCLNVVKKLYSSNHLYVSSPYKHIGQIYLELKKYQKSKQFVDKGLKILQKSIGKNNPKYAITWKTLGRVYLQTKEYSQAINILSQCLKIFKNGVGSQKSHITQTLFYLKKAYRENGNHIQLYKCLKEYLEITQKNVQPNDEAFKEALYQYQQVKKKLTQNQIKQIQSSYLKI